MLAVIYDGNHQICLWCRMTNITDSEFEIHDPDNFLTPRERDVLTWLVGGKENEVIAMLLSITRGTVKFHVINLLRKFEAHNRQLMISRAWKAGLVKARDKLPAKARHLVITLLVLGSAMPGISDQPVTVRTPRVTRVRSSNRRDSDDYPVVQPMNLADLRFGDREAA